MPRKKSALKHGLYARRLTKDEIKAIGAIPVLNIDGEIAYQRALINRLGQIIESTGLGAEANGPLGNDSLGAIRLMNELMARLLTYLKFHDALKADLGEVRAEIERGKMLGRQRRHVFDYFKQPEDLRRLPPARGVRGAGGCSAKTSHSGGEDDE